MTDKPEFAKKKVSYTDNHGVVKTDENRYIVLSNPYDVVINVSYTLNSDEENKKLLDFLGGHIGEFLHNQIE